ncbi:MAG: 2-dehydropantoate 2-reductase [Hyphomicrobiaceae bacterium]|nr:2-dehydropantoate 2-reductase [Hyphomicrobiaceae bacterium]
MKICVYGAGAIGGYVGLMLKQGGADVSLIARGPHLEAINKSGMKVVFKDDEKVEKMPASSDPADFGPQDYVIVALKAHQAWQSVDHITPLLGPDTAVVTMQNGIPWWYFYGFEGQYAGLQLQSVDPDGKQWRVIGPERAIGATVYPATEITEPGVIRHIYGDKFGFGEPDRSESERVTNLIGAFEAGGLKARFYPEIRNDIWLKLWGNLCFNPISALTGATLDVVATDTGTRAVARAMMEEAEKIARRIGVHFRVDIERRINGAASVGAHRTSMLQDLDKKRPIELDALLGVVQEMARIVDVETPTIDTVLALTKQMGRVQDVYPVFPEPEEEDDELAVD